MVGEADLTHIFYQEITGGNAYHRSLSDAGSLSARESISATMGTANNKSKSILKPLYFDDRGDATIMVVYWDDADDKLHSRLVVNDGSPSSAITVSDVIVRYGQGGSNMALAATGQYASARGSMGSLWRCQR